MRQVQLATRIDQRIKGAVVKICKQRGQKMNRFIEEALLDKLEELEDIEDIRNIQKEPTRPIEDILKELKLDGLL
jgi:hypothetical protein